VTARPLLAAVLIVLAGCGSPRVDAVDAVTGAPVAATARPLGNGLLVEADGYASRIVPPGGTAVLVPLWEARFMAPGERPPPRRREAKACCPVKAR